MMKSRLFFCFSLLSYSLVFLTGCPGYGDVLLLDKEAVVSMVGENVCFWVYDSAKHKPSIITITQRGSEFGREKFTIDPPLILIDDKWCITPNFYIFPDKGQFIVSYSLPNDSLDGRPQRVVSGVEVSNGNVHNFHLTDMGIIRPYSEMDR